MLTLYTGAPGAGKTALMVDELTTRYKGRPWYVCGLEGFKPEHVPLSEAEVRKWHEVLPDGAVLVIDEAQRIWRPTGPGQKIGDDIAQLETHRHRGIDVLITTQGPHLVHKNVRALTGRHVHIRDVGPLGRRLYEWPECSENLAWRSAPVRKGYKLPKRAFGLYTSSSLHVKPHRSFPVALLLAGFALVGTLGGVWVSYQAVFDRDIPSGPLASASSPEPRPSPASRHSPTSGAVAPARALSSAEFARQSLPVVPGRPETAPMYDALRVVVRMPRIMGGFCSPDIGCRCYINDGLRAPITAAACAQWVESPPFDPYYAPPVAQVQSGSQGAEPLRPRSAQFQDSQRSDLAEQINPFAGLTGS